MYKWLSSRTRIFVCPVQFQSVPVLFPSQYFASAVLSVWAIVGPSTALWPTLRLASLQVSPVWPDYCYIAGWPPVDHHQCNVSSVGARQITPITQTTIEQRGNIVTFSVIYSDSVVITACSNTIKVFQAQLKGQLFQWKTYAHFSWKLTIYTKFSLSEKL